MVTPSTATAPLNEFYAQVEALHLRPLWLHPTGGLPHEPDTVVQPFLWRWADVRASILRAGELVPVGREGADRRVLTLVNPTVPGGRGTTRTLGAAVQLIYPGERAPSHRHTAAAIRFVIEGSGACTIVNGEPLTMEPGDFILTPNWTWHGHIKETEGPIIWLDVLDVPLVRTMNWMFYEEYPSGDVQPPEHGRDESLQRFGASGLRPATVVRGGPPYSPLQRYPWTEARAALERLAAVEASPFDGVLLSYVNPLTGGPVMPTMGAALQLLRPGEHTRAHRHTTNVIYHVAEGAGYSILNGQRFDWAKGDTFCVPTWTWHEHCADASGPAVLFSITDAPLLEALDLYREEARP